MEFVHPVADEWTEQYALYAASAERVLLSAPCSAFLAYCSEEGLRPVLYTGERASVSPALSLAMRQAGGFWAFRADDGRIFDGISGYRIGAFEDLWLDGSTDRERHPAFSGERDDTIGVLTFDIFAHHEATERTRIGPLVEHVFAALDGGAPAMWDEVEPLARPWNVDDVTLALRRTMPQSRTLHVRSEQGSYADISVGRTRRGLLEHVRGGVSGGRYEMLRDEAVSRGALVLESVAQHFRPTIAFASIAESEPGGARPSAKRSEAPLAVYLGPRAVRDLGIDPKGVATRHDAVQLGRDRVPSLLVRFSGPDPLWQQLTAFAFDLDSERLLAAVQGEFEGGA